MSDLYLGSIDLSKIDKSKIKEFTRKDGSKGKSLQVAIFIEENPTEDWKACSIQQSVKKGESKIFLGNGKKWGENGSFNPVNNSEDLDLLF